MEVQQGRVSNRYQCLHHRYPVFILTHHEEVLQAHSVEEEGEELSPRSVEVQAAERSSFLVEEVEAEERS